MSNGSTPPGGWWLWLMNGRDIPSKFVPLSIPAAAAAQLGAVTRDIDDAAEEESDELDNADSRVVSVFTLYSGMGLFIEILESRMFCPLLYKDFSGAYYTIFKLVWSW